MREHPAPQVLAELLLDVARERPLAALAALVEPRLRDLLRERHDEDWFRNPRAGETLFQALDGMRAQGAVAWAGGGALEPGPLARRVTEALSIARR